MPRGYPHSVTVREQYHVGYSLKHRANEPTYFVYFRSPDGRRLERDTKQTSLKKATDAAHAIIAEEYAPTNAAEAVSWDEAVARLRGKAVADGIRATSVAYYEKLVRLIRNSYRSTSGPADISPGMAEAWKRTFTTTKTRRGELPSPHTVFSLVRGFRALWQNWFIEQLDICPGNPWEDVTPPKTDKPEVRVIDEAVLADFLRWIDDRYSGWALPRLFLETKAVTGCRLMDLCEVKSAQLRDGRLEFRAEQTKGRKARSVPLPPGLYARLEEFKGPTYLWESYPSGLITAVRKMGCPTHRIKADFVPGRLYHWIETLFLEYSQEHPDEPRIHSHQLRKRALTAAWEQGIDPRKAAIAIGCNPDTVMKHYVKLDEQAVTDEVVRQLAERLRAPTKPPADFGLKAADSSAKPSAR